MSKPADLASSTHERTRSSATREVQAADDGPPPPSAWFVPRQRESSPTETTPASGLRPPPVKAADVPPEPTTGCVRCARRDQRGKRVVDVSGALVGLVAASPLFLLAAAAIRAEDGGPVLFRQERIGENGRPFTILKFRTMTAHTEHTGTGLVTYRHDPRITRVGRTLRATSLDELPQLLNILRGEMSLVGPRPTVRSQVERYTPFQQRRLVARPGLAGWAQINGRNSIPWSHRIELDVWYVENRSLRLDLLIMLRTFRILVSGSGAYGADGRNADLDGTGTGTGTTPQRAGNNLRRSPRVRPVFPSPAVGS
ncbi:sugar transferase [Frankia sp. Cpl3]|nr:sugar transferase [Frankia sp. Cpl3]